MSVTSRALVAAVRLAPRVPEPLVRGAAALAAEIAWLRRGAGVRRLESNLARVRPDASPRELRALSHAGMRTYLRYYAEAFTLPGRSQAQVDARVWAIDAEGPVAEVATGRSVVLALGHQGNWDLAGAWATRHIAPVTTVAERLEPPEMYEAFVGLRTAIGLTILPLDDGHDVFRALVRTANAGGALIPLLADRDLTARGVEVELFGQRARVAAGPAALALATGAPLFATLLRQERLPRERRRSAGARWGLSMTFVRVDVPPGTARTDRVRALTQAWVDVLAADVAERPEQWHMLQRVFVADLDPARLAASGSTGGER